MAREFKRMRARGLCFGRRTADGGRGPALVGFQVKGGFAEHTRRAATRGGRAAGHSGGPTPGGEMEASGHAHTHAHTRKHTSTQAHARKPSR